MDIAAVTEAREEAGIFDTSYKYIHIDTDQVKELYTTMSDLVYADMDKQYKERKINGSTYASTWTELMKAVVAGSMNTIAQLQMKETEADKCVKESQCDMNSAQIKELELESSRKDCLSKADCLLKEEQTKVATAEVSLKTSQQEKVDYEVSSTLPSQVSFTERQTSGFDDNKKQKMLEIQMNAWAMMYSSGIMNDAPGIINGDSVSDLYCKMSEEIGLECSIASTPPAEPKKGSL
jgi:hypothetical protein